MVRFSLISIAKITFFYLMCVHLCAWIDHGKAFINFQVLMPSNALTLLYIHLVFVGIGTTVYLLLFSFQICVPVPLFKSLLYRERQFNICC